jgi:hypothetical protein
MRDNFNKRIPSQIEKIIDRLKAAGDEGVTNTELNNICLRYGARLSDLYKKGYYIENEQVKSGIFKYVLKKISTEDMFFQNAADETIEFIKDQFDDRISSRQLRYLLEMQGFQITRKPNWYKNHMKRKIH